MQNRKYFISTKIHYKCVLGDLAYHHGSYVLTVENPNESLERILAEGKGKALEDTLDNLIDVIAPCGGMLSTEHVEVVSFNRVD